MTQKSEPQRFIININELPHQYPTHLHIPEFWECLGRVVATYGYLEEVLGKAIFSFTATRRYEPTEIGAAYKEWLPTLHRALSDPLGGLINSYGKAVRENPESTIENLEDLLDDLRFVATIRNALCHGSWRAPDENGKSIPLFVNNKGEKFDTPVDITYLEKIQFSVTKLACDVVNTVTHMGWQFPGSKGSGKTIF